jgi:hypothetical protein
MVSLQVLMVGFSRGISPVNCRPEGTQYPSALTKTSDEALYLDYYDLFYAKVYCWKRVQGEWVYDEKEYPRPEEHYSPGFTA